MPADGEPRGPKTEDPRGTDENTEDGGSGGADGGADLVTTPARSGGGGADAGETSDDPGRGGD